MGSRQASQDSLDTVSITVTHSQRRTRFANVKLDRKMTVADIKLRLFSLVGTSPPNMVLKLCNEKGIPVTAMMDNRRTLESYSPSNGMRIHVTDTDPKTLLAPSFLADASSTRKFVMSDADYDKRANTFRRFKAEMLAKQRPGMDVLACDQAAEQAQRDC